MKPMIRAAAAAAILLSGLGSIGCVNTGTNGCGSGGCGTGGADGRNLNGDRYRNAIDPCYPERYNHAARQAVIAPFAQQVQNGYVLNQTIYNYYFEFGTDKLTPAGIEKLNSLARTRPVPDSEIFLQTARDLDPAKTAAERAALDSKRADAIVKVMDSQPSFAPVKYKIAVHDPVVPGMSAEIGLRAYNGSLQSVRGSVSGGGGSGSISTGGGATQGGAPSGSGGTTGGTGR